MTIDKQREDDIQGIQSILPFLLLDLNSVNSLFLDPGKRVDELRTSDLNSVKRRLSYISKSMQDIMNRLYSTHIDDLIF